MKEIEKIIRENNIDESSNPIPMQDGQLKFLAEAIEKYVIKARIEELERYMIVQDEDMSFAKERIAELKAKIK